MYLRTRDLLLFTCTLGRLKHPAEMILLTKVNHVFRCHTEHSEDTYQSHPRLDINRTDVRQYHIFHREISLLHFLHRIILILLNWTASRHDVTACVLS